MREIKFRIFTTKNKMEYYNIQELINLDNAYELGERKKETDIMQFTGLQDKNGKDIYENDIVNENGVVHFVGGRYIIVYDKEMKEFEDLIGDEDEVFGNIYETPELLN